MENHDVYKFFADNLNLIMDCGYVTFVAIVINNYIFNIHAQ